MSRRNSESAVYESDSLCPGVCLKSISKEKGRGIIKNELSGRIREQALH